MFKTGRRRWETLDRRTLRGFSTRPSATTWSNRATRGSKYDAAVCSGMVENPFSCERCGEREAVFWVFERYEAPDGIGAVESEEPLCRECIQDVGPSELENAYANYIFRIEPVAEAFGMTTL